MAQIFENKMKLILKHIILVLIEIIEKENNRNKSLKDQIKNSTKIGTAMTLTNLGTVCYSMGEYSEAKEYYQRSLEIEERVHGKDHISTAVTLDNLGKVCYRMGEYSEAKEYYQKGLEIKEGVYGKDHTTTAVTLDNQGLGRIKEQDNKDKFKGSNNIRNTLDMSSSTRDVNKYVHENKMRTHYKVPDNYPEYMEKLEAEINNLKNRISEMESSTPNDLKDTLWCQEHSCLESLVSFNNYQDLIKHFQEVHITHN